MKNKKSRFGAKSKMALAATMMTVPMFAAAQKPTPDASPTDKSASSRSATIKSGGTFSVVGSYHGHTVYKNDASQYFWIDKATGDQKFLSSDAVIKQGPARSATVKSTWKNNEKVTVVGKDANGHVIQKNARGQKFYLDPATGDMVLVK
jgi:hypothetical protein